MMENLTLNNIFHSFPCSECQAKGCPSCDGTGRNKVLNNVNLKIETGQIVALVGPSGCGKTTLLNAILGTHPVEEGTISVGDKIIDRPTRDIGIVYQNKFVYDFLNTRENVAFGPMLDQTSAPFRMFSPFKWRQLRQRHLQEADALLDQLGILHARNLYPKKLSGGMRQRASIAQALIMRPKVLLYDEPFSALDEATKEDLQLMLLAFYQENLEAKKAGLTPPHTIFIVTHELNEAFYVSDRVVGLSQYHEDGKNGATIVYDKAAPVFHPDDSKDYSLFIEQREELRKAAFDETNNQHHQEFVTFWNEK